MKSYPILKNLNLIPGGKSVEFSAAKLTIVDDQVFYDGIAVLELRKLMALHFRKTHHRQFGLLYAWNMPVRPGCSTTTFMNRMSILFADEKFRCGFLTGGGVDQTYIYSPVDSMWGWSEMLVSETETMRERLTRAIRESTTKHTEVEVDDLEEPPVDTKTTPVITFAGRAWGDVNGNGEERHVLRVVIGSKITELCSLGYGSGAPTKREIAAALVQLLENLKNAGLIGNAGVA